MSDFKAKMHQIRLPLGLSSRLRWGSLQHSQELLAVVFKKLTSNRREVKGKERKGR